ncbi:MAG: hypothetical protein HEQ25_15865 [Dolichospermum sp. DET73]|nr:hypothetical protein [Dolichospermum sp. DET73]
MKRNKGGWYFLFTSFYFYEILCLSKYSLPLAPLNVYEGINPWKTASFQA